MSSRPNAQRKAKMRTLTLTDEAWARLGQLGERAGSRSAAVEAWLTGSQWESTPGPASDPGNRG